MMFHSDKCHSIHLFSIVFLICICQLAIGQRTLTEAADKAFIQQVLVQPKAFHPVPTAIDGSWKASVPPEMRNSYIAFAERYLHCKWQSPSLELFREFQHNGNRTNYEDPCFVLRKQLANLVMAEILEQKGRFIPDIVNGIKYFHTETWWGIPAHYPLDHPERDTQVVDLFNSETANLLAWTVYMLQSQLDRADRNICEDTRKEITRRVLIPALNEDYWWKHSTSNWNTWICENWLSCVLLCETDRQHEVDAVCQIIECLNTFYSNYPDDGGCNEGVFYWIRAAASLSECLQLLDIATDGKILMANDQKFRNMSRYVFATYITNNTFINFADSPTFFQPNTNVLFPLGHYLNDPMMLGFAALVAEYANIYQDTRPMFSHQEIPCLSRELLLLSNIDTYRNIQPQEPIMRDNYLPDLQIFTARDNGETSQGLFVAMKGGHNDEEHNHNDVGNFVIYADGQPVIIDIGRGTYTAQAGTHRYDHLHMRSAYHNVPLVNGMEQKEGKQYHATILSYKNKKKYAQLKLDLTNAYPAEAALKNWKRTVRLNRGKNITIKDKYKLYQYRQPTEVILISCGESIHESKGRITIQTDKGIRHLIYDEDELTPVIEKLQIDDPLIRNAWQQKTLFRIRLIVRSHKKSGTINYTIE